MALKTIFFSFFYYLAGIIDTLVTLLVILIVSTVITQSKRRKEIIFGRLVKNWGKRMVAHTGSTVKVEGLTRVNFQNHYLILSNHCSNFDIYLILGYIRLPICFISKQVYFKIPFIGNLMNQMGCVKINRNNPREAIHSLTLAAEKYREGQSIIIYPEGTRSQDGKIKPFKKGFIHMIEKITSDCHLLPVTLSGVSRIQTKGERKITPSKIIITIHQPIEVKKQTWSPSKRNHLLQRIEQVIKQSYREQIGNTKGPSPS